MKSDQELLERYAKTREEAAFSELVRKHVNLVWSVGYRVTRDADLARDVAQSVFADLARKASSLSRGVILSGWLYRAAYHASTKILRTNARRAEREKQAMDLQSFVTPPDSSGETSDALLPLLDEAMSRLDQKDRDALVMRFFGGKSLAEVGATLGISDDAAQKRLTRALERLRRAFARQGITATSAAVAAVLGTASAQSAPAGIASLIASTSLVTAGAAGAAGGLSHFFSTAKSQLLLMKTKIAVTSIAALAVATPVVLQQQTLAQLRGAHAQLSRQAASLPALQKENASLTYNAALAAELDRLRLDHAELLELRQKVDAKRQADTRELFQLREQLLASQTAAEQAQHGTAQIEAVMQARADSARAINDLKQLGLAARLFANDHNETYPTNFEQMTRELAPNFPVEHYEFVRHAKPINEGTPQLLLFREKQPRQQPDGSWARAYTRADGSVMEPHSETREFEDWEKQIVNANSNELRQ